MTQDAIITKLMPDGMAEVAVTRGTACGSNCGNCESCIFDSQVKALARNHIDAKRGEKVVISSKSSMVFGAAMLVYVMPLAMFLIGFLIAHMLGASEGVCVAVSFAGLALGAVILVLTQRMKKDDKPMIYDIIGFAEETEKK